MHFKLHHDDNKLTQHVWWNAVCVICFGFLSLNPLKLTYFCGTLGMLHTISASATQMRNKSVALHQEKITHQTEKPKENIILIKTNKNAFVIVFFLHNFSSFFESIRSNNILSPLRTSNFLPWMRKNWCTRIHFPSPFHNWVLYTLRWIRNGTESERDPKS